MRTGRRSGARRTVGAVLAIAALVATSCGDDDGDDEGAPPTEAADGSEPTTDATTGVTDGAATTEPSSGATSPDGTDATTPGSAGATDPSGCVPGDCEPSEELIAAAQAEGELAMYTSNGASVMEALSQAFEEKYGVRLNYTITTAAEVQQRVQAELDADNLQVDFVPQADESTFRAWYDEGYIRTFTAEEIPNLAVLTGEGQFGPGPDAKDGDGPYGWYTWGGNVFVLTWNADEVPYVPESFCDLTKPEWAGLVGGNFQPGTTNFVHHKGIKDLCGEDYFVDLADNGLKTYPSTTPGTEALAAGEIAVFLNGIPQYLVSFNDAGAHLEYTTKELATAPVIHSGVLTDAPHPNAAQLYANFLLSKEAQELLYGGGLGVSVLPEELVPDDVKVEGELLISTRDRAAEVEGEILEDIGLQ